MLEKGKSIFAREIRAGSREAVAVNFDLQFDLSFSRLPPTVKKASCLQGRSLIDVSVASGISCRATEEQLKSNSGATQVPQAIRWEATCLIGCLSFLRF